jgi:hypothetical protein
MIVKFKITYKLWNAGDIAGFPDDEASELINLGIAEKVDNEVPNKQITKMEKKDKE